MSFSINRSFVITGLVLGLSALAWAPAQAQGSGITRAQVQMERDAFLSMARWDAGADNWVLRDDMPMPKDVKTREEVKAMRDKFLSMHNWDNDNAKWVPVTGAPRDMSKLTREQVAAETARFLKMYRFNERSSEWVSIGR